jgi:hypothetical protein
MEHGDQSLRRIARHGGGLLLALAATGLAGLARSAQASPPPFQLTPIPIPIPGGEAIPDLDPLPDLVIEALALDRGSYHRDDLIATVRARNVGDEVSVLTMSPLTCCSRTSVVTTGRRTGAGDRAT